MTPEQKEEMRKKFEAWAAKPDKLGQPCDLRKLPNGLYDNYYTANAWDGFQAAYTPKPDVMAVARAIRKEARDSQVCFVSEIDAEYLAQAAIDAIFNKEQR